MDRKIKLAYATRKCLTTGTGIKSFFFSDINKLLEPIHCQEKSTEPLVISINDFFYVHVYVLNKYSCIYAIVALNMQF